MKRRTVCNVKEGQNGSLFASLWMQNFFYFVNNDKTDLLNRHLRINTLEQK